MKDKDWKDWQSVCMSCEGSTPTLPKLVARFFDKSDQYWFATLANCISQLSWPFFPAALHLWLLPFQSVAKDPRWAWPAGAKRGQWRSTVSQRSNMLQSIAIQSWFEPLHFTAFACWLFSASECDWKTCRLVIVVKGCQRHKTCIESSRCKWSASLFRIGI